jgi:hypothetical protein
MDTVEQYRAAPFFFFARRGEKGWLPERAVCGPLFVVARGIRGIFALVIFVFMVKSLGW